MRCLPDLSAEDRRIDDVARTKLHASRSGSVHRVEAGGRALDLPGCHAEAGDHDRATLLVGHLHGQGAVLNRGRRHPVPVVGASEGQPLSPGLDFDTVNAVAGVQDLQTCPPAG